MPYPGSIYTPDPSFYRDYFEEYEKPYVRVVNRLANRQRQGHGRQRAEKIEFRIHRDSPIWGLVCIDSRCGIHDVHRHVRAEIKSVIHGGFDLNGLREQINFGISA